MKPKTSLKILLLFIAVVSLFHVAVFIHLIPYEGIWGGRLQNNTEMYVFESISILANLFLGFALLIKGEYLSPLIPSKALNFILWFYLALFCLNTLGNLFAETLFEQSLSLVTLGFSFLIWRVLKTKGKTTKSKIH